MQTEDTDHQRRVIELAYGLLWHVPVNVGGTAVVEARRVLFDALDQDGMARGIAAARDKLGRGTARPAATAPLRGT